MPFWNPHQHNSNKYRDFSWVLEVLKNAFWKIKTEKDGNTLKVRFIPGSKWMGEEVVETLSIEAGAKGEKGDTGPRGLKGDKGDPGSPGAPGERGLPGDGVYCCGATSFAKVTANRALHIGSVSHVADGWCNAFMLSVYVECGGLATGNNFQAYNGIIVTDRTGVNFIPVSYNCHQYSPNNGGVSTAANTDNEYWMKGIIVTFSEVDATPNSIYLLGPNKSFGLCDVVVQWSIMPFMGTAESMDGASVDATAIVCNKETYYI